MFVIEFVEVIRSIQRSSVLDRHDIATLALEDGSLLTGRWVDQVRDLPRPLSRHSR